MPPASEDELVKLVGPIALYPDDLVAIILPVSTNPPQLVQADRYLDKRKADPKLPVDDKWDDPVKSLLNYPDVVKMMSADLEWTAALGEAVVAEQGAAIGAAWSGNRYGCCGDADINVNRNTSVNVGGGRQQAGPDALRHKPPAAVRAVTPSAATAPGGKRRWTAPVAPRAAVPCRAAVALRAVVAVVADAAVATTVQDKKLTTVELNWKEVFYCPWQ